MFRAFFEGIARCFDLFGAMPSKLEINDILDDKKAIETDWNMVSHDFNQAIKHWDKGNKSEFIDNDK
jgi:hypothetical protein